MSGSNHPGPLQQANHFVPNYAANPNSNHYSNQIAMSQHQQLQQQPQQPQQRTQPVVTSNIRQMTQGANALAIPYLNPNQLQGQLYPSSLPPQNAKNVIGMGNQNQRFQQIHNNNQIHGGVPQNVQSNPHVLQSSNGLHANRHPNAYQSQSAPVNSDTNPAYYLSKPTIHFQNPNTNANLNPHPQAIPSNPNLNSVAHPVRPSPIPNTKVIEMPEKEKIKSLHSQSSASPNNANAPNPINSLTASMNEILELLEMGESNTFQMCLSLLLKKSSDSDSEHLLLDKYPKCLTILINVLESANPLKTYFIQNLSCEILKMEDLKTKNVRTHENHLNKCDLGNVTKGGLYHTAEVLLQDDACGYGNEMNGCILASSWPTFGLPCVNDDVYKHMAISLDSNKVLLTILAIMRNISANVSVSWTCAAGTVNYA